jgi:hypothetical protein
VQGSIALESLARIDFGPFRRLHLERDIVWGYYATIKVSFFNIPRRRMLATNFDLVQDFSSIPASRQFASEVLPASGRISTYKWQSQHF